MKSIAKHGGVLFLLSASVVMYGCSAGEQATEPADQIQTEAAQPDKAYLEELFWTRLDESRTSFVEEDVTFMTDMIVHHAQAIIMSRLAPENEASGQIQRLAARILAAQEDEIALMQKWLRDRTQPVPVVRFDGIVMHVDMQMPGDEHETHHPEDHHESHRDNEIPNQTDDHSMHAMGHGSHDSHGGMGHDHHDMPGMLTQEQLEQLEAATGEEFDILFLRFMIEHHQGAVWMVDQLFAADGAATDLESYRLAVDIYAEQVTEIQLMNLMLEERGEEPVGPLQVNGHDEHEDHHEHNMHNEHNSHSGHDMHQPASQGHDSHQQHH